MYRLVLCILLGFCSLNASSQKFTLKSSGPVIDIYDSELHDNYYYFRWKGRSGYELFRLDLDSNQPASQIADSLSFFNHSFESTTHGVFGILQSKERKLVKLTDNGIQYIKNFGEDADIRFLPCADSNMAYVLYYNSWLSSNDIKIYSFNYSTHKVELLTEFDDGSISRALVYKNNLLYNRKKGGDAGVRIWDLKKQVEVDFNDTLGLSHPIYETASFSVVDGLLYFAGSVANQGSLLYETDLKNTRLLNKSIEDGVYARRVLKRVNDEVLYWAHPFRLQNTYVLLDSLGEVDTLFKQQKLHGKLFKDDKLYYSLENENDGLWEYDFNTKQHQHIYKSNVTGHENGDIRQIIEYQSGVVFLHQEERAKTLKVGYYKKGQLISAYAPDSDIWVVSQDTTLSQHAASNIFEYDDNLYLYYRNDTTNLLYRIDVTVVGIDFEKVVGLRAASVFPNPTTSQLNLRANDAGIEEVRIYNSIGELIYLGGAFQNTTLNTQSWQKGIYHVSISTEGGTQVETVVKR